MEHETSKKQKIYKICYLSSCLILIFVASLLFRKAWPLPLEFAKCLPTNLTLLGLGVLFCARLFINARKGVLLGVKIEKGKYPWGGVLLNASLYSLIVACPLWLVGVMISLYQTGGADSKGVIVIFLLIFVTFLFLFVILNILYFIAYLIMPKKQEDIQP